MTDHSTKPDSPWKFGGLSLKELGKRTFSEMNTDDAYDIAAALGYYFLLAIFPMLIFLVSFASLVRTPDLLNIMLWKIGRTMPPDAYSVLWKQVQTILGDKSSGSLLTVGILGTLWAASSGVVSLMDGLNRAYEVKETRSILTIRLRSVGLTVGLTALTILGSALLVASDQIGKLLYSSTGMAWMKGVGGVISVLVGLGFMFVGLEVMFFFGPNVKNQKWNWVSPGSVVGVGIFLIISFVFSIYLRFFNSYNATYGSLGGVILLLLWLYNLGLAIVIGGEINSEIAKAARARGNMHAPEVGEEAERDDKEAGSHTKSAIDEGNANPSPTQHEKSAPYKKPVNYQPQLVYTHDDSHLSLQAKRRIAMRRIRRNEQSIEQRDIRVTGWAILKRPLVGLLYLGSIGFYMYQSITKHSRELQSGQ